MIRLGLSCGRLALANFSSVEVPCRGTGKLLVNEAALDRLRGRRNRLDRPFIARSAYCRLRPIAAALAGIAVAIYARIDDWQRGRR